MKKSIFLYGLALASLVALLKFVEYRLFVHDLSLEFYVGVVAVLFTALGVWVGLRLTRKKVIIASPDFKMDQDALDRLGLSKRELEVLEQ